jgi:hypothetical protein
MSVTPNVMPKSLNEKVVPLTLADRLGITSGEIQQFLREKNRFFYVWREDAVHVASR